MGRELTRRESAESMTPSSRRCRMKVKRNTKNAARRMKTCCNLKAGRVSLLGWVGGTVSVADGDCWGQNQMLPRMLAIQL